MFCYVNTGLNCNPLINIKMDKTKTKIVIIHFNTTSNMRHKFILKLKAISTWDFLKFFLVKTSNS